MDIARVAGIIEQRTLLPFLALLGNQRELATSYVSLKGSSEVAIACGLRRGDRKWPSPSSRVVVLSVKSGGGCGQQDGSELREAVNQGCTLWVWDTPPEPDRQTRVWEHAALTSTLCL